MVNFVKNLIALLFILMPTDRQLTLYECSSFSKRLLYLIMLLWCDCLWMLVWIHISIHATRLGPRNANLHIWISSFVCNLQTTPLLLDYICFKVMRPVFILFLKYWSEIPTYPECIHFYVTIFRKVKVMVILI